MNTKRSSISPIPWLKIKWRRYELDLELCIRCQVIRCQPTSTSHLRSIITYFQSITYNYQSGNAPARLEGDRSDCQCSDCINAKKNVSPRLSVVLSFHCKCSESVDAEEMCLPYCQSFCHLCHRLVDKISVQEGGEAFEKELLCPGLRKTFF